MEEVVTIRIRVNPMIRDVAYEIEGTEEDILKLPEKKITELNYFINKLSTMVLATSQGGMAPTEVQTPVTSEVILPTPEATADWFEIQAGRPHLGPMARKLSIKDLILLAIHVHRLPPLKKQLMPSKEIYQFLVEDGFPVSYASLIARLSEMTRDGTLIRLGKEGYRLSRKADDRIQQILSGGVS